MAKKVQYEITADTSKAQKATKDLKKETAELKDTAKSFEQQIDKATGGAVTGLKNVISVVKGLTKSFTTLKTGVTALGLGLFMSLAAGFIEWLRNSREGAELLEKGMAAVGAVMGQLGSAFSALIKGDISGFADAILNIGVAVKESVESIDELFETQDKFFEFQQKSIAQSAEYNKTIAEQLKLLADTTLTFDERESAIRKLAEAEEGLQAIQEEGIRLQIQQLELANVSENNEEKRRENLIAIANLEAELIKLSSDRSGRNLDAEKALREISVLRKTATEAELKAAQEAQAERDKLESEQLQKSIARQLELDAIRLQVMAEGMEKELMLKQQHFDKLYEQAEGDAELQKQIKEANLRDIETIEQKYRDKALAQESAYADGVVMQQKTMMQAKLELAKLGAQILSDMSSIFSESDKVGKAFAVASIIANQAISLTNALAVSTAPTFDNVLSFGVSGFIKFAKIAATITSTVAQVKSTLGSAPSIPVISPVAGLGANAANQNFAPQVLSTDQIAAQFNQDALRAYVLVGDVNNGQDAENKLNNLSTI